MIQIYDVTLRDGSHANKHQFSKIEIEEYTKQMDSIGVGAIEVGHGNGNGASSMHIGVSKLSDEEIMIAARKNLKNTRLGAHFIPGFSVVERDVAKAVHFGVDIFRIASHCTEANLTKKSIEYVKKNNKIAYGVLMMSSMASKDVLWEEASKMESYGADCIIIMDSAGAFLPARVRELCQFLKKHLSIPLGFHAHNNLGLAVANSLAAFEEGATILDATMQGYGAGAGNTQMEALVCALEKSEVTTNIKLDNMLQIADWMSQTIAREKKGIDPISISSGQYGVFSGFSLPVQQIAKEYGLNPHLIFRELGKQKVISGQEDQILKIVLSLIRKKTQEGI